jgi:hypothetical protein
MNRYQNIPELKSPSGKTYRKNVIYPEVPLSEKDYYVITTAGDRYDTLAQQFYNDYSLWWIIAAANNSERASLVVQPGIQLRIPTDTESIISNFNSINR